MVTERQNPDGDAGAQPGWRLHPSAFVVGVVLFALVNAYLSFFTPVHFDRFNFPYRGWAWWALNDLRRSPDVHNVALLGSSLTISAISSCDANYLGRPLDLTSYHRATYLDHRLRTTFGGMFNTYDLALPGAMPSDAYFSLRAMVNCAHRPDVVIYGVAPRDFLDSTLSSPLDTEAFRYFRRLVNLDDVSRALFRTPMAKINWWLERQVYLYGNALDFQLKFGDWSNRVLARILPRPASRPAFTFWDRERLLPGYKPAELCPGSVIISPADQATCSKGFKNNTREYQDRYRSPDLHTYRTQLYFLKQLLQFCRKERIELIVVNMPISFYNTTLMAPGEYPRFVQHVRTACFEHGVTYYDLAEFDQYRWSDYHDSVHLNPFGGKKFVDRLVDYLAADRQVSQAMALAGKELERYVMASSNRNGTL